jgi:Protein of unknown function (DUF3489)
MTKTKTQPKTPAARTAAAPKKKTKINILLDLLRCPEGACIDEMVEATGWQTHSVRGAMAGAIKKKLGLAISSEKTEAGRVYRIVDEPTA